MVYLTIIVVTTIICSTVAFVTLQKDKRFSKSLDEMKKVMETQDTIKSRLSKLEMTRR